MAATGYDAYGATGLPSAHPAARTLQPARARVALPDLPTSFDTLQTTHRMAQPAPYPDSGQVQVSELMEACFLDPHQLPVAQAHGPEHVAYGRVFVHMSHQQEHEIVRHRMASNDAQRNYLAHLEHGAGPTVVADYYAAYDAAGLAASSQRPLTSVMHDLDDPARSYVRCAMPIDQGSVSARGGLMSPALVASHELTHAARMVNTPSGPQAAANRAMQAPAGYMGAREERFVILEADNHQAWQFGEGLRDGHKLAGRYQTSGVDSAQPVDPRAHQAISDAQPVLWQHSLAMDQVDADVEFPQGEGLRSTQARYQAADQLGAILRRIGAGR